MTFPACSGYTKRSLLSGGAGERGCGGPMGSPQGWRRWEGGSGMRVSHRAAGAVAAGAGTCPRHHVEDAVSTARPQDRWDGLGSAHTAPKRSGSSKGQGTAELPPPSQPLSWHPGSAAPGGSGSGPAKLQALQSLWRLCPRCINMERNSAFLTSPFKAPAPSGPLRAGEGLRSCRGQTRSLRTAIIAKGFHLPNPKEKTFLPAQAPP